MSLFVASLNSGSNGNCYYVGTQDEAVLIDGGISCRETEKRMKRLGLSIKKVKAVFVSHEHGDHIHGVTSLSKKHQLPVYITRETLNNGKLTIREDRVFTLKADAAIPVGNLTVRAFPKFHDASDPYSFMVSSATVNVGIFTDIGRPCENVIRHFSKCHAAFLESNYDEDMLENGGYPLALKNRIRGGNGHLSNRQARICFRRLPGKQRLSLLPAKRRRNFITSEMIPGVQEWLDKQLLKLCITNFYCFINYPFYLLTTACVIGYFEVRRSA
jgi:phosphoribosyl 1,2-cyclic phosphodiesterase